MDVQLRMQHIARYTDENAEEYIRMYDELCSELTHMYGTLTAAAQSIIADVVYLEQTKAALIVDIAKRGVSTMVYNGRQHYLQANKHGNQLSPKTFIIVEVSIKQSNIILDMARLVPVSD